MFADYRGRKAKNTLRRQAADLALFNQFLDSAGVTVGNLAEDPRAWAGVSWGLVKAFTSWQLQNGYAVTTVNGRLSTVKVYCSLAALAGAILPGRISLNPIGDRIPA